jgi:hypothetical protein
MHHVANEFIYRDLPVAVLMLMTRAAAKMLQFLGVHFESSSLGFLVRHVDGPLGHVFLILHGYNHWGGNAADVACGHCHIKEKQVKVSVVELTHAVVDPGAVVIKAHYASLAHGAVVRSLRLRQIAFLALPHVGRLNILLRKAWIPWLRDHSHDIVEININ